MFPSENNCDLKITGSDKSVVAEAAYQHAIGSHQHAANEPGLREEIAKTLIQE
jgi:hypothetical protein